jgi:hypothetical protein
MHTLTIAQAARHLGISDQRVRQLIDGQELFVLSGTSPVKLSAEHVETVRMLRREAILYDLAARQRTPVYLAHEARRVLLPSVPGANLPQYRNEDQRRRLGLVASEARQLFGVAALTAACTEDGCRWCTAQKFAEVLGGWAPDAYAEGFAALFGQEPCERCGPGLFRTSMDRLAAQVRPGGMRPSVGRTEVAATRAPRVPQKPVERAVTAAAQPRQDDDGKSMVQRRLRVVRARLKTAKRANDQKYAIRLQQTLKSLMADAARVDGLTASAALPGTLRCGHPLAAGCSCPRLASRRER